MCDIRPSETLCQVEEGREQTPTHRNGEDRKRKPAGGTHPESTEVLKVEGEGQKEVVDMYIYLYIYIYIYIYIRVRLSYVLI